MVSIGPRVSRGWWRPSGLLEYSSLETGFNRAARFARLVAQRFMAARPDEALPMLVSIGPRVSRGWWHRR